MTSKKITTIKNGNDAITIYYNQYSGGAEYWERIISDGNAAMKDEFDRFMKVNIFDVIQYFPYEWGKSLWLAKMYAEAKDYKITYHTEEKG